MVNGWRESKCWMEVGLHDGRIWLRDAGSRDFLNFTGRRGYTFLRPEYTKMSLNGAPMGRHGLILSQDGAIPSRMLFTMVLTIFSSIFGRF